MPASNFTPRETVSELDRYIVGQDQAKKAVAIALRNRWRRQQLDAELAEEIAPKNIIMIGPTGVGKTEIARRMARLTAAPFIKVEASKFTEVGYVGRDVESMIRDLTQMAINLVKDEHQERVVEKAKVRAEERVLDMLLPDSESDATVGYEVKEGDDPGADSERATREKLRKMLRAGSLDERQLELETPDKVFPSIEVFTPQGMEEMDINFQDLFGNMVGKKTRTRRLTVPEALELVTNQESAKLVDIEKVTREAIDRVEQTGIIFLDEIDKVAGRESAKGGPDVSREGVQRDLLPIIEGSQVNTKHGIVRTDHILFIAAGAFHVSSVNDLIPEMQGRFPIRVQLHALNRDDFVRILTEPRASLTQQYIALLGTEDVTLTFTADAVESIADVAATANEGAENIGARRLHTVMERLLEDLLFTAPERGGEVVEVDAKYVREALADVLEDQDLARYIL
jgi:ATP-dependent HslUV protease ATP-binding subunit HslU